MMYLIDHNKDLYIVTNFYFNKRCSFELSIHQRILKEKLHKILSSTIVFNIAYK